jgi:hypothetical protein
MRFKTKFCWFPVRLVRSIMPTDLNGPTMEFIGWAWLTTAPLTKNINHGWIHVLDSEPFEYKCPTCKQTVRT